MFVYIVDTRVCKGMIPIHGQVCLDDYGSSTVDCLRRISFDFSFLY